MAVDDLIKQIEISEEYLEKFKKEEISKEDFYQVYKILLEDEKREADNLKKNLINYESGIAYFKRGFVELQRKLLEIESDWFSFFERDEKYLNNKNFKQQVKDYDEMQKRIEENKKGNQ